MYKNQIFSLDRAFYEGQTPSSTLDQQTVVALEGREYDAQHLDAAAPTGTEPESYVSGLNSTVRAVRNMGATTCAAGALVKIGATGYEAQRTAGQSGTAGERCLGVVHHRCLNGIRQYDIGPVVVRGPVWVKKVSGALTVGQKVEASATAGSVQLFADTSTDDQTGAIVDDAHAIVGEVMRDAASGDATVEIFVGKP